MDQVKTQLAVVMKYGFWIASSLVLLASLGIWYMTTSQLSEESTKQTSKIQNAVSTVSTVKGELPTMPNDHSHEEMNRLIEARQDEVVDSWQTLYDRQRDILTWPVKELKQDFVDEFVDLFPIERYVAFPTDPFDEKETTLLTRYQYYIKNVLPDIAKIGGTEWMAGFESGASMGMMGGMSGYGMPGARRDAVDITGAKGGPLVKWESGSQSQVLTDLFPWRGKTPKTLEVYYSQENLWILKQLLQIIADVNGEARQPYQAKIHEIRSIGIGRSVKFGSGQITTPGGGSFGGMGGYGMDMDMDMMEDYDMEMMDGYDMGMDGGFGGSTIDPADNRYVNASLEQIDGATLRSALESNSPNDASLAVAKRVPVMLSLNMDQRAVPELLAACGSAPLMVDVTQVRVLPKNATPVAGGGGMGMDMEMESEMEMDMESEMDMGMGMGSGPSMPTAKPAEEFPLDMSVEVYGIIYIYNPPDPEKLGVMQVTEDTVIDGATETIGGEAVAPASPQQAEGELPTPQPAEAPDANQASSPPPGRRAAPPTALLPVRP